MRLLRIGCTVMTLLCGACAKNPAPPMLTINATNCVAMPDLTTAREVRLKDGAAIAFNNKTPCLQPAGGAARLYSVFRLPESTEAFWVTVTSAPRGQGIVAPYVALLDQDGKMMREMAHDRFVFRGTALKLSLRPQSNERYLLVSSTPDAIGQTTSGVVGNAQATAVMVGTGFVVIPTAWENERSITRAHGGVIAVTTELIPSKASDTPANHQSMAPLR